ncbi:hypothetical protein BgAZ_106990 [Babesia gibsoni]|uniref:Uncharacterized protein n=1 Tax=Babesia gibsoni TaxID=33632 RepID=A0AAD8UVX5_BABGI|nr:hypothetical protein BgAZ_106990 [Babesia gibsoni]
MVPKAHRIGIEYDLKSKELPEGAEFVAYSGGAYFFSTEQCHYALDEHLDCIQQISTLCRCRMVSRYEQAVALAARSRLYQVDLSGSISERKLKKRLLQICMVNHNDCLQVLICRDRRAMMVQLGEHSLILEVYNGKCDCDVLLADFVGRSVFCLVYRNEGVDVRIAMIGICNGYMTLLRNDLFRKAKTAKMSRAVGCNDTFLLTCDDTMSILRFDPLYCVLVLLRQLPVNVEPNCEIRLLDQDRILKVYAKENIVRAVFCILSYPENVEVSIPVDGKSKEIIAINNLGKEVGVLLKADAKNVSLLQFIPPKHSEELILFDNKLNVDRPTDELCGLICSGKVALNSQLVDYIMDNNLLPCAIECLKSIYIPEREAIRIIARDTKLLRVLIQHTKGDEHEMIMAIRHQMSIEKCAEIIEALLDMLDNIEEFGEHQMHCYKRIIGFINLLLDAKSFNLQESNMMKKEWIERLQALVKHCTADNYNLQSLLSFTTSLLKSRKSKQKTDQNSLVVSFPISV